ncbi:MGMT family protein [Cellulomonas shaoxiangyii]|uniref:Cysteine methyltransferase n=1 Tax=Cellulomonas shaoxiangyii TaxID=2566013 RepID=A0A4P7SRH8_9CELL|nr:MGMT family protein [Cellulomonas shaoxiangyii]QCB95353.1 cysteine methyltransferase [Cellulomonas shaoxiangyii]TGY85801.1 cysteine methyltransferase [Cellulomonas shaoxiangyii]
MDDAYVAEVLAVVAAVPPGRAITYGLVAEVVADRALAAGRPVRGGPRQVGRVLARADADVPWWRVVTAAGSPPAHHLGRALAHLRAEGTPLTPDGTRVRLRAAVWFPQE